MVSETTEDGATMYECEECGMLFEAREEARTHEENCDGEGPSYIQ
ncbi:DUF7128 family protein [Halovenus amylolytica]